MKHPILHNSEILNMMKKYSEKKMEYKLKNINKQPYEIMEEIENEEI